MSLFDGFASIGEGFASIGGAFSGSPAPRPQRERYWPPLEAYLPREYKWIVTYQPVAQKCPVCEGRAGKLERDGFVDCRACDGKGIVWPPAAKESK